MDTDDITISTLTSEDALTGIHAQSDLPFEHTSRRTKSGFLVDGPLLQPYIPTQAGQKAFDSWIYKHGEGITRRNDGQRLWLCRLCYERKPLILMLKPALPTTTPIRHLVREHGYNDDGTRPDKKRKATDSQQNLPEAVQAQIDAQKTTVDKDDWKDVFLAWAIADDVSLSKTASKRLRRLLSYRAPLIKDLIPQSRTTTRRWIIASFKQLKPVVIQELAAAKSRITLSFDAWKSDNELDLLGITAHYVDEHYQVKNTLLALRNTYGPHFAEELKHHLLQVTREYKITNKLAFFMSDSASNNDAALRLLEDDISIDTTKQRLRCTAHVVNLVCKAILYGCDTDCIEDALSDDINTNSVSSFEKVLRSGDEVTKLQAWRKKGAIGKLHNIVIHARATPKRREYFKSKQKEAASTNRLYQLVVNGGIRWNSTCDMLERAFKLKDTIELYQQQFKSDDDEPLKDDILTSNDWAELKDLLDLLQPLKEVSKCLQSDGKDCNHGSLWEALTAMDYLLTELETLKEQHLFLPDTHFKASINLGWKKLNKFYSLSDETAAYRVAIAVHPCRKMKWFESKWRQHHPEWIDQAKTDITTLYNSYKRRHADEVQLTATPSRELTKFERYNLLEDDYDATDDLERYFREERAPAGTNPLTWWQHNHHRYPILRHMAFDLLGAPASSSADERTFSKAGRSLNEERFNTLDDLAEAVQCPKSWMDEGIIYKMPRKKRKAGKRRRQRQQGSFTYIATQVILEAIRTTLSQLRYPYLHHRPPHSHLRLSAVPSYLGRW